VLQDALTLESLRDRSGQHFAARGFREIMTPSLANGERAQKSTAGGANALVKLANPLSAELDVMRPTMLAGVLQAMTYNINRQQRDLRFFERGRVYGATEKGSVETETLSLGMTGRRWRERWRSGDRKTELADVKEEVESMLERMGINALAKWSAVDHPMLRNAHALHIEGRDAGFVGEVTTEQLKQYDVSQPVYYAEINETALLDACRKQEIGFTELLKFPSVRRDLSLLLDAGVRFETLRKAAFHAERKLLRDVDLFDVYEGDKLPKGKKSYAISLIFQDPDKTLTDEVVEKAVGRIRQAFEKEVGAELRG
jgi:phenylalanyl-tRNA synthetase beta chain